MQLDRVAIPVWLYSLTLNDNNNNNKINYKINYAKVHAESSYSREVFTRYSQSYSNQFKDAWYYKANNKNKVACTKNTLQVLILSFQCK